MISQQQWLQSRKKLLRQVKSEVELRLGPQSTSLRQYAKNLDREFSAPWRACPVSDLDRELKSAKVALGADFHAYSQSQRAHIRLLRKLPKGRPIVLALECLSHSQTPLAQSYIEGAITEREFLKAVEWDKHWGFPWEHYRPLFELAKAKNYQLVGLMPENIGGLNRRDQWMADEIARICRAQPKALVYVVVGEWHLAQKHLPGLLRGKLAKGDRVVTILQDSENLYFRLAKKGREESTDCLKRSDLRFCLMVSPPWMKWQSYLLYLEHTYDRDLSGEFAIDYSDHVLAFVKMLQKDLRIQLNSSSLHVYGPSSKLTLKKFAKGMTSQEANIFKLLLEHDRSFLLPQYGQVYLSRPTINHAATMSGQFVHGIMAHRTRTLWKFPNDFLSLVWVESVGFFFSKWINPKRKSEDLQHLKIQLAASQPTDQGRESLLLALELQMSILVYIKSKRLRALNFKPRRRFSYLESARIMGSVIGERFYQRVRRGEISLSEMKDILSKDLEGRQFSIEFWKLISLIYEVAGKS